MNSADQLHAYLISRAIVKASELAPLLSARAVLAQAQLEADRLVQQAQSQAAQIRAQAQRAAEQLLAEERARGFAQGLRQAHEAQASALTANQVAMAKSWQEQDGKMSHLVMRTLSKILTEGEAQQQFFASVSQRVLRAARDQRFLVFNVSTAQLELARACVNAALAQTGAPTFVEVHGQDDLPLGTCVVESEHAQINASLDSQLGALERAVMSAFSAGAT